MNEQIIKIKKLSNICAKFSKIIEVITYPFLLFFVLSYGLLPLIKNNTDNIHPITDLSVYGRLLNYMSSNAGIKVTYVFLLFIIIGLGIVQIILMNKLHIIFKRISNEGVIFIYDNIKPFKEATILTIIIIIINIPNVLGLFFSICLWTIYLIYKYQSEIQGE